MDLSKLFNNNDQTNDQSAATAADSAIASPTNSTSEPAITTPAEVEAETQSTVGESPVAPVMPPTPNPIMTQEPAPSYATTTTATPPPVPPTSTAEPVMSPTPETPTVTSNPTPASMPAPTVEQTPSVGPTTVETPTTIQAQTEPMAPTGVPAAASVPVPPTTNGEVEVFEGKGSGKYKVVVLKDKCIGAASCVAVSPKTFELNDQQIAKVLPTVTTETDENLLLAAQSCPTMAIEVYDTTTGEKVWPK